MKTTRVFALGAAAAALVVLSGCATTPMGPTVQVMPGVNKPFAVFQQDHESCKAYAESQVSGQAEAANQRGLGTAAVGVVLGGALGAAMGGHQGAGVVGATGAIMGSSAGANSSAYAQNGIQMQYNNAYMQCMYARGNQVPGAAPQQ